MTNRNAERETLVATAGEIVVYHAPGGTDYPALVLGVTEGTTYVLPFTEAGQAAAEGTGAGQWSARA